MTAAPTSQPMPVAFDHGMHKVLAFRTLAC